MLGIKSRIIVSILIKRLIFISLLSFLAIIHESKSEINYEANVPASGNSISLEAQKEVENFLESHNVTVLRNGEDESILPPSYMIDLYHKYSEENFPSFLNADETSMVRCIWGKVRKESLSFNLSSVGQNDKISHAEIHLYRKKSRNGKLSRIKLFLSSHLRRNFYSKKLVPAPLALSGSKRGWKNLDVSKVLRNSVGKWGVLGLTVESLVPEFGRGEREVYHSLPLSEIIRTSYKPFLIIFSTTSSSSKIFKKDKKRGDKKYKSGNNQIPSYFEPQNYLFTTDQRNNINDDDEEFENSLNSVLMNNGQKSNYIGENYENNDNIDENDDDDENIGLNDMSGRVGKRSVDNNEFDFNEYIKERGGGEDEMENQILPILESEWWIKPMSTFSPKSNRKKNKNKQKSKKRKQFGESFTPFSNQDSSKETVENPSCKLEEIFIPLGFEVIFPASFPIGYCKGSCSNPNENVEKSSNSSISVLFNSFINSISTPTCIPTSFKRLTLLYLDSFQTIVLKSFPNATITNCSC